MNDASAVAPPLRGNVELLQKNPVLAQPGAVVHEEDGMADRLPLPLANQRFYAGVGSEDIPPQVLFGGEYLPFGFLIGRQFPDEAHEKRCISGSGGTNI